MLGLRYGEVAKNCMYLCVPYRHPTGARLHNLMPLEYRFTIFYTEIPKTEKLRKPNIFPRMSSAHQSSRLAPNLTRNDPRSTQVTQLCLSAPTSQMHVASAAHRYFVYFLLIFFYFEDCENVKKSCSFLYG